MKSTNVNNGNQNMNEASDGGQKSFQVTEDQVHRVSMYIYILPNLMTTGNLLCGFFAITQAIQGSFLYAAYSIVAASVFDQLDGRLARLTRSTSKFGAEYDSLCDLVSFGVAPALLLYKWSLSPFGRLGWVAAFLFITTGALRLARFNVQAHIVEKNYFQGLPIPMAAGIVASAVIAFADLEISPERSYWILFMTFLLSVVMVSNFRYRSFKDLDLKQRLPFRYLLLGVGVILTVVLYPEVMLFFLFISYAILGAVFGFLQLGKKKLRPNAYAPASSHETDLVLEDEDTES